MTASIYRPATYENVCGIENFIQRQLGGIPQPQQHYMQHQQPQQPGQPLVEAVNAVLLSEAQPMNNHINAYHHQTSIAGTMQPTWQNAAWPPQQQDGKTQMLGSPSGAHAPQPHHQHPYDNTYATPPTSTHSTAASSYTSNRPSPYPMPPHHLKHSPAGQMPSHLYAPPQQQQQPPPQHQQPAYHQVSTHLVFTVSTCLFCSLPPTCNHNPKAS